MLYRSDLYVCGYDTDKLRSEISVKIHGAMMKHIPAEYAKKLHISEYHPYAIYAFEYGAGFIVRVSALNEEAKVIVDAMSNLKKIKLFGIDEPLTVTDVKPYDPIKADTAGSFFKGKMCRAELLTPAMIKTGGYPSIMPDIPKYFYSVILKYNAFENNELNYEDFLSAFYSSKLDAYSLESVKYNVSGHIFPGMSGYFDIIFPSDAKKAALLKKIFFYSSYCGIGGKTGLGMGGVTFISE